MIAFGIVYLCLGIVTARISNEFDLFEDAERAAMCVLLWPIMAFCLLGWLLMWLLSRAAGYHG